jgi:hypothetical protein
VLHEQHGHALSAHLAQDVDDLLGFGVIGPGAGLIGEQQRGPRRDGARKLEPAQIASRQVERSHPL